MSNILPAMITRVAAVVSIAFLLVATTVTPGFVAGPALAAPFLTGSVFNDVDYDGVQGVPVDVPLVGVTVTVTDSAGVTATAATIADGTYSVDLAGLTGTAFRVEVDPADPVVSSPVQLVAASGSDFVQFSDGSPVDFVLRAPGLSPCQSTLYISCFNTGLHDDPSNVGEPAILNVPWSTTAANGPRYVKGSPIADIPEVGAVWGLGVQDRTGDVFTSAVLRRHNDFGPGGLGGLYKNNALWADLDGAEDGTFGSVIREVLPEDPSTPALESYMNIEGAPTHPPSGSKDEATHDFDAYAKTGTVSIGGLDVGPDDDELFFVNLASRELWSIGINADGSANVASAGSVGGEPWLAQSCTNGVARAWAVKTWQDLVHVGVVCTGEVGGVEANLTAHMYAFDPAANTWSGDLLGSMSLVYPKECTFNFGGSHGCGGWLPWHNDALTISGPAAVGGRQVPDGPTPILSDFAFDPLDGSVVLSFLDRSGLQMAHSYLPYSTALTFYVAGGDIVKATWDGAVYTPNTAAPEFYNDDFRSNRYGDSTWGSVATFATDVPGERHVMTPGPKAESPLEGLHVFDQDTGAQVTTHQIGILASPFGEGNNGKSLALGELDGAECGDVVIGNRVWLDVDQDGIQGAGESGVLGVTVSAYSDADGVPNSGDEVLVASKVTDASGWYEFSSADGLEPHSDYVLVVAAADAPAGTVVTVSDALGNGDDLGDSDGVAASGGLFDGAVMVVAATGSPGETNLSYDIGYVPAVSIGSFVWNDLDADGVQDALEPGIAGATVELLFDSGSGGFVPALDIFGAPVSAVVTAADGLYHFDGLPSGDYRVRVTPGAGLLPSATQTTADNDATENDSNIASEPIAGTFESGTFNLAIGAEVTEAGTQPGDDQDDPGDTNGDMTVDFSFYTVASIGDTVWLDVNADGVQDVGELGIENVTVNLLDAGGAVVDTATTDVDGFYEFVDLTPGEYAIGVVAPAGYVVSALDQGGDDAVDSDVDPISGQTAVTSIASGESDPTWDAGLHQLASIGDTVWLDVNADGVQDVGELGIAGVTVNLLDAAGAILDSTTTDVDGFYEFVDLTPGEYAIGVVAPAGYVVSALDQGGDDAVDSDVDPVTSQTAVTDLSSGENDPTWDAGLHQLASIGDTVWDDLNADGVQDVGEVGVENVTVNLLDAGGAVVDTTTTDADGFYEFVDLTPGEYAIGVVAPAGYVISPQDQGADDGADSDIAAGTGQTVPTTLVSGENDLSWDAGLYVATSIGDTVWEDLNADGIQDAGELGLENVTVNLLDSGGGVIDTTTTDVDGFYEFTALVPGDYAVEVVVPAGYAISPLDQGGDDAVDSDVDPVTSQTAVTDLSSGENDPTWDVGLYVTTSIGDTVWEDLNADGIQDAGELGLENVTVNLLDSGGAVIDTATTDVDGFYEFVDLTPGDYAIGVVAPAGYVISPLDQGGDDAVDSDVDPVTSQTAVTDLSSGENDPTWDVGLYVTTSIGDTVWDDLNADGVQDVGELGIAGVTVNLLDAAGAVVDTTTTDVDGFYEFVDLTPGDYAIGVVVPAGYVVSAQDQGGDDAVDSDIAAATGETAPTTLSSNENDSTWDAGLHQLASIGDTVWLDVNADGVQDVGELGVETVTVNLLDAGGAVIDTTTTDVNGFYEFVDLTPGDYAIGVVVPAGYVVSALDQGGDDAVDSDVDPVTSQTAVTDLSSGENDPTWDAGLHQLASIGDTVWYDQNTDGIQDVVELGIAGVTVNLLDAAGAVIDTATTDVNGFYEFVDLTPGDYAIGVVAPAGYVISPLDQDGDETVDSDVDPVTSQTAVTALSSGENDTTWDAGLFETTSLGDFVWHDLNLDGVQDSGEPGIADVMVNLVDDAGVVLATMTTDASGFYRFDDLLPGSYQIEVVVPGGYAVSPPTEGGDPTLDSDISPTTAQSAIVVLASGDVNVSVDAGLFALASLGDTVWFDIDADGVQDTDELPAAGVTVDLILDGAVVETATTNVDGGYLFDQLVPDAYVVRFTPPADHRLSDQTQGGDPTVDSDPDPATGETAPVTLAPGEDQRDIDAGLVGADLDLAITIELSTVPEEVGDIAVYRVDVENVGNAMVDGGVEVELMLSAGLDYITAAGDDWVVDSVSADGRTVVLAYAGAILPGEVLPPIDLRTETLAAGVTLEVDATVASVSGVIESTSVNNVDAAQVVVSATVPVLALTGLGLQGSVLLVLAFALIVTGVCLTLFSRRRII